MSRDAGRSCCGLLVNELGINVIKHALISQSAPDMSKVGPLMRLAGVLPSTKRCLDAFNEFPSAIRLPKHIKSFRLRAVNRHLVIVTGCQQDRHIRVPQA